MKPEAKPSQAALLAVQQALDRKADGLGASQLTALSRARNHALTRHREVNRRPLWLGGLVAAAAVTLAVVLLPLEPELTEPSTSLMGQVALAETDFELVLDAPELELVENLEFYLWLESEADS